jgi:hypothetical protein
VRRWVTEEATGDRETITPQSSPDGILARLVAEAVQHGADELTIEYRDGCEEVCAMKNGFGFGIANLDSSGEEACALREQLCAIGKKASTISVGGATFRLQVSTYDSFGEDAYRVRIQGRPNP